MSLPSLCLLTSDIAFRSALMEQLGDTVDWFLFDQLTEAQSFCLREKPAVLIADFRQAVHGGHLEQRFLELLQPSRNGKLTAVLVAVEAPEPLERCLACSVYQRISRPWSVEALTEQIRQAIAPAGSVPSTGSTTSAPAVAETTAVASRSPAAAASTSHHPTSPRGEPRTPSAAASESSDSTRSKTPAAAQEPASSSNPSTASNPPSGPATSHEPAVDSRTDSGDSAFVITGLSRRFETNTPRLRMMLSDLEVAARHDVTVLLIGETGAGKTFLSRLIHEISPRRHEPFLTVACGALPADLIESELFGHVKGAFTSAHSDKDGKFVAARRGTILLDEIDVLGLEQQVKLLRVIESGEFEPVGSNTTLRSEARLIVASNVDLQPLVEQGKFRADLYYRLNMLKFELAPLRARRPDIIPLAKKFVAQHSAKHNVRIDRIDDSLLNALLRYPWPGNVRELEHVIQRAVIYCRDAQLTAAHLPSHVVMCVAGPGNDGKQIDMPLDDYDVTTGSLGQQVALSEREIIEQALFKNQNSRTNTAKSLGISRVTLYNKMKKYGMT